MAGRSVLRFFLDNNVPDSVGRTLAAAGHVVIYQRDVVAKDAKDGEVALTSALNDAILITFNRRHFKAIASRFRVSNRRLKKLSRIDLMCTEPEAAKRIEAGLSFIEFEWQLAQKSGDKRMFLEIQGNGFKTTR